MAERDDHNAPHLLVIRWLPAAHGGRGMNAAGWYVVRVCACCYGERVCSPKPDAEQAAQARDQMLKVAS